MAKAVKVVKIDAIRQRRQRKNIETSIAKVLDGQETCPGGLAGFAIVVWGLDGSSTAALATDGGVTPTILIPDFVRNRLLGEKIEAWTIESINRSNGF